MIPVCSDHLADEIAAARQMHPLARRYLREIKERIDQRALSAGANLHYCARDTLAALAPGLSASELSSAASSATILLSLHVQARGYRGFTNGLGVRVWVLPL